MNKFIIAAAFLVGLGLFVTGYELGYRNQNYAVTNAKFDNQFKSAVAALPPGVESSANLAVGAAKIDPINEELGDEFIVAPETFSFWLQQASSNGLVSVIINQNGQLFFSRTKSGQIPEEFKKQLTEAELLNFKNFLDTNLIKQSFVSDNLDETQTNSTLVQAQLADQAQKVLCTTEVCKQKINPIINEIESITGTTI